MKIYVLIHEQDTESAWGSHVSLFLNRDLAEASMRKCWEDALKSWEFGLDKEMYDDHCWEYNHDNAAVLDGMDIERWRIEEQDLAVGVAVKVHGGLVQSVIANADVDLDVYDLDVSDFPDEGEEDEADERRRVFEELASRPDWRSVW
ncbi:MULTISPECIES: hypothetical protein [Oscillospiraceae]|uniref:Uncharacterized protein n=1 Tax=Oscillibacter valericigenes TaxID=351091 RepID=A0ABS2FTE6_9FIRM|nr:MULTISPECIES: hypothetical protein [Oscillospiraceae]MBM6679083.1 hypothetical protein [Pseudoflavonifractor capillosus]MBM6850171.1 hypothetical protein [Oscillibacter valericigenes]